MKVAEVASYESEPRVVDNVLFGIFILVEAVQVAVGIHTSQDFFRVSSSSKRHVYINACRMKVHAVDAFVQQYRYMINLFCFVHYNAVALIGFTPYIY